MKFNPNDPKYWQDYDPAEQTTKEFVDNKTESAVRRGRANRIKAQNPDFIEKHKIAMAKSNAEHKSGENSHWYGTAGPMGGKTHTEEAKRKSARHGADNGMYGKGELVAGERNGFYGRTHTDTSRQLVSQAARNRKEDQLCEHCGGTFTAQAYKQHHGDRCDMNPNRVVAARKKYKKKEHTEVTCPHCGKVGSGPNMSRYHFDNCKQKGL